MSGEWSIAELAKSSGLTSRTLRHYDEIGLLPATAVSGSGMRFYDADSVLRLQRILVLRELGLSLSEITGIVDQETDAVVALRSHLLNLLAQRDRFDRLAATVARTIAHLERENEVKPEELFEGLSPADQARYESELIAKYGPEAERHIAESKRRMASWGKSRTKEITAEYAAVEDAAVELINAGVPATDPVALELMERQFQAVAAFWTPDRQSFTELGGTYVQHPDFRARYDAKHPALAEYLRDAMTAYADRNLS
ncbi:MerR family transcriptional regulator [Streptomyces sp. NPDC048514]|uniref:MerR family transcriptional regulator n=1 Tax=Streptomyces sp. NPDC048514 TaxID=3365564 RepID=UPI0037231A5A